MTKYNISNIAISNSQYFRGHHLPVVQVMVDEDTTYKDIKASLKDYPTYDHLFEDDRFGNKDGFDGDVYKAAVEELFANFTSIDYVPDSFYEIGSMNDNEEWDCYMYFVVEEVEDEDVTSTN